MPTTNASAAHLPTRAQKALALGVLLLLPGGMVVLRATAALAGTPPARNQASVPAPASVKPAVSP